MNESEMLSSEPEPEPEPDSDSDSDSDSDGGAVCWRNKIYGDGADDEITAIIMINGQFKFERIRHGADKLLRIQPTTWS